MRGNNIALAIAALAVALAVLAICLTLALAPAEAFAGDVDGECSDVIELEIDGEPQQAQQSTITQECGVYDYNGVMETWYSSNVLYHWRTPEWTPDEEGFWRTDEGYYVVATDAWPEGAIIETSKGLAQVLDCGCGDAVDFYTNFDMGW